MLAKQPGGRASADSAPIHPTMLHDAGNEPPVPHTQRVRSGDTNELTLDPRDKLFIVHVGDKAERRKSQSTGRTGLSWESGGPLVQPLQEALSSYNHTTVELQGGHVPSAVLEWATDNAITLVVAGSKKAKGGKMIVKKAVPGEWGIGSTADAMLQITKLPLLVVQPDAVRSLGRANLRSQHAPDEQPVAPKQLTRMLSPPRAQQSVAQEDPKYKGRVVVIATEGTRAGQAIVHWAARNMLEKRDHVHVLRVHSKSGANSSTAAPSSQGIEALGSGTLDRRSSFLERASSPPEDVISDALDGTEALAAFNVVSTVTVKGDTKDKVVAYAEEHSPDLLIIGRSLGSRLKKALTPGGTVSHHLMIHAPCPVLVLPYRALGLSDSMPQRGDMSPDEIISPREPSGHIAEDTEGLSAARLRLAKMSATAPSAAAMRRQDTPHPTQGLGSPEPGFSVENLKRQLSDKDVEISNLREEVRQLKIVSDRERRKSIPEHQQA